MRLSRDLSRAGPLVRHHGDGGGRSRWGETHEWVAGFALLEAPSLEDAIDLASRNPAAHWGRVEVRPVHSFGGPLLGDD